LTIGSFGVVTAIAVFLGAGSLIFRGAIVPLGRGWPNSNHPCPVSEY